MASGVKKGAVSVSFPVVPTPDREGVIMEGKLAFKTLQQLL
jgi:hypothetical protein